MVDLLRGDYLGAGLDLLGVIPFAGEIADDAKYARRGAQIVDGVKTINRLDNAYDGAKVINSIEKSPVHSLIPTHAPTLSKKRYGELVEDISENGIKESIKYVEYRGKKYVVDGHHRLKAAKKLNLTDVPTEKVYLPYKGYDSIDDLFWDN